MSVSTFEFTGGACNLLKSEITQGSDGGILCFPKIGGWGSYSYEKGDANRAISSIVTVFDIRSAKSVAN